MNDHQEHKDGDDDETMDTRTNIEALGVDQQQEKVAALHPPNPELEKEDDEEEVAVRQHEEGETEKGAEEGTVL
jgi:hypothetical protein